MGTRTPLGIGVEEFTNILENNATVLCPEDFNKAELKLINLVEGILRQQNIQTMAWLLLAAFTQVYKENYYLKTGADTHRSEHQLSSENLLLAVDWN